MQANRRYSTSAPRNFDVYAHAGVAVLTCMDSRLQPLGCSARPRSCAPPVTEDALNGCILGRQSAQGRILVITHPRFAMAACDDVEMRRRVTEASGRDTATLGVGATTYQRGKHRADVKLLTSHLLVERRAQAGGSSMTSTPACSARSAEPARSGDSRLSAAHETVTDMTPATGMAPPASELRERATAILTGRPDAAFHPGKYEAIEALVADRRRALVVQRTGWGKSAVYFIAALLRRSGGDRLAAGIDA